MRKSRLEELRDMERTKRESIRGCFLELAQDTSALSMDEVTSRRNAIVDDMDDLRQIWEEITILEQKAPGIATP